MLLVRSRIVTDPLIIPVRWAGHCHCGLRPINTLPLSLLTSDQQSMDFVGCKLLVLPVKPVLILPVKTLTYSAHHNRSLKLRVRNPFDIALVHLDYMIGLLTYIKHQPAVTRENVSAKANTDVFCTPQHHDLTRCENALGGGMTNDIIAKAAAGGWPT